MALWLVRGGRDGKWEQEFLENGRTGIGWAALPDLSKADDKAAFRATYAKLYRVENPRARALRAGQVWRFCKEISRGDLVGMPLKSRPFVAIGRVDGDYAYYGSHDARHQRAVKWIATLPKSAFPRDILNGFGARLTVATIQSEKAEERVQRLLKAWGDEGSPRDDYDEIEAEAAQDLEESSRNAIIKLIGERFKGHDLARLVGGILAAKGYRTRISPPGRDGGVDILASPGPMGFGEPRICVQVKSSERPVSVEALRMLEGVANRFGTKYCILAAWGGLNDPAAREMNSSFFTCQLWDQGDIADELVAAYDRLDPGLKSEIPLKRIWTVAGPEPEST